MVDWLTTCSIIFTAWTRMHNSVTSLHLPAQHVKFGHQGQAITDLRHQMQKPLDEAKQCWILHTKNLAVHCYPVLLSCENGIGSPSINTLPNYKQLQNVRTPNP